MAGKLVILWIVLLQLAQVYSEVGQPCNHGRDCAMDECCLSNFMRRGRRSEPQSGEFQGTCQKLGVVGSSCLPSRIPPPANGPFTDYCPCMPRLVCIPGAFYVVPQGFVGTCQGHSPQQTDQSGTR